MDNSNLEGWMPDYRSIGHRRSMEQRLLLGWTLIGLGASLLLAIWARWREHGR